MILYSGARRARRQVERATSAPLTPIPVAGVFDRVGVDVLHFPKSSAGNQYAIVFVDYLTKWPEVFAALDQTAFAIAKLFVEEIVCRHKFARSFCGPFRVTESVWAGLQSS